jgi:predicted GIY-YIG superfamily endonuclease
MPYVYMLRSKSDPAQRYIGVTRCLKKRFKDHNAKASVHTAKHGPWELVTYMAFAVERRGREFEHYLKSGSGRAFANKRLW